jgi:cytochrome d ubiquinol oxidase subunit II
VYTGALALVGLAVARSDAPRLWDGLTEGAGLAMVIVSATAGIATIVLVWRSRFTVARASAALAVAAIVAGWGLAQRPYMLPGLTVSQAAAGRTTLIAVIIAAAVGAIVLVPSLVLLFTLFLRGRLDSGAPPERFQVATLRSARAKRRPLRAALTLVALLAGVGLMVFTDAGWAHVIGIGCLAVAAASAFAVAAVLPEPD